jgi:hypothetical protein
VRAGWATRLAAITINGGSTSSHQDVYSGIQIPKNQNPQFLKSGLKIGVTQLPM